MKKLLLLSMLLVVILLAGHIVIHAKEYRGYGGHGRGKGDYQGTCYSGGGDATPTNDRYAAGCGGCHFAFPPVLLPSGSWKALLDGSGSHFGTDLGLAEPDKAAYREYLTANAADASSAKVARKIMDCLGGATPLRVTAIPYIQRGHRKLDPAVFQRKSVQSLANCVACHKAAPTGRFDDDDAVIPAE